MTKDIQFFVSLLVFLFSLLLTCSSQEETITNLSDKEKVVLLIKRSLQQTGTLIRALELNQSFAKKHYVPKELQIPFLKTYIRLKKEYQKIPDIPAHRSNVIQFLLLKHLHRDLDSVVYFDHVRHEALPENPIFMAFAMIMEEMPNLSNIGNSRYIDQLANSFGVSRSNIIEGIYYYLIRDELAICREVALVIEENLYTEASFKPEFYFQNIMLPFLTYTSMGLVLRSNIESAIFKRFNETFYPYKIKKQSEGALLAFVIAFRNYLLGESLHVRFENNLNKLLLKHDLYVYIQKKACVGYRVLEYAIPIRRKGIGDVVFLDKISVSLSMNYLGLSIMRDDNVVLTMDNFIELCEDLNYAISMNRPYLAYEDRKIGRLWNELELSITTEDADKVYASLIIKEMGGLSRQEMINTIIREVAVHEIKHKWDEINGDKREWYNVDSEISAHLTAVIYGGAPCFSLLAFISRCENYYASITIDEVRTRVKRLIIRGWEVAHKASMGMINEQQIVKEAKIMYETFRMFEDNSALPKLEPFEREIIKPCLHNVPLFDLTKLDKEK